MPTGTANPLVGTSQDGQVKIGCHTGKVDPTCQTTFASYGQRKCAAINAFSKQQVEEALRDLAEQLANQSRPAEHTLLLPVISTRLEKV